jgi:hypothetical protein
MTQTRRRSRPSRDPRYLYLLLLTLNVVTGLWRIQVTLDLDLPLSQDSYASRIESAEPSPNRNAGGESDAESQDEVDYSNLDSDSLAQDSLIYLPWMSQPMRYRPDSIFLPSRNATPEPPPPRHC